MSLDTWLAFVLASSVLLMIPGPTILTVVSYTLVHGRGVSVPLVLAVALGDATAVTLSLLGLGALLAQSALLFSVVKTLGAGYLIYLGIKQLSAGLAAPTPMSDAEPTPPKPSKTLFKNTYWVTALNPKGIVFFVAFLPQFVDPTAPVTQQLWILAATFVVLGTLNAFLYILFAASASGALQSPRLQRRVNIGGGSLLLGAGVYALLAKHTSNA